MKFAPVVLFGAAVAAETRSYTTWMADAFIKAGVSKNKGYQDAVLYGGIEKAYELTRDKKYLDWYRGHIDGAVVQEDGSIAKWDFDKFIIDEYRMGHNYLYLYFETGLDKYKSAADIVRSMYDRYPRSPSGGFWHQQSFKDQMWLDGIYMADSFYAKWTHYFDKDNTTVWDDILLQYELIQGAKVANGLYVHGWAESSASWANPDTGRSPHVWGRALGWFFMSLVETLQFFPKEHPGYEKIFTYYQDLAASLKKARHPGWGVWLQVLDEQYRKDSANSVESSASAMFVWGFLKGIRLGYLDKGEYLEMAKDAYASLLWNFVSPADDGSMLYSDIVAECNLLDKNVNYEYYTTRKIISNGNNGGGPFMLAAFEYETWARNATA